MRLELENMFASKRNAKANGVVLALALVVAKMQSRKAPVQRSMNLSGYALLNVKTFKFGDF